MPARPGTPGREISNRNLRTGPPTPRGNTLALKHGARSEAAVRPLRERYVSELQEAFPSATPQEIAVQAHRLAQLQLLGEFMDERGVIRHKRRGEVFPAAHLMEKIAGAFERQHAALLERERNGRNPTASLDLYLQKNYAGQALEGEALEDGEKGS